MEVKCSLHVATRDAKVVADNAGLLCLLVVIELDVTESNSKMEPLRAHNHASPPIELALLCVETLVDQRLVWWEFTEGVNSSASE